MTLDRFIARVRRVRPRTFAVCAATAALLVANVPVLAATDKAESQSPAADAFPIYEYRVLGNTLLPQAAIERAVYPHLGPAGSLDTIEKAREALATAYRDAGYGTAYVDIPEQTVDGGIVRLKVTEGRLDRVKVSGAEYSSARQVRALVPSATAGRTPNLKALQDELANVARVNPDRQVTPLLRAGRSPGTVDLELKVDDAVPVHGSLEVNDRYTADTSELRANALVSYDQAFGRPDSVSLQYQWSPEEPGEVSVWALSYVRRSLDSPNVWVGYAVKSNSDVATLGALTVLGKGRIFGLKYIAPATDASAWLRAWSLGVDYKDFTEDVLAGDGDPARTPISYGLWSASATVGQRWTRWAFETNATLNFGLRLLGNTAGEFAFKRFGGRPNFAYLRGDATLSRALPAGFGAALRTRWQYSPQPLIGNEQFGLGGFDTVRGYLEAESLVDTGVSGSLELLTPQWKFGGDRGPSLQALAFLDAGVGSIEQPLPSQAAEVDLSSYGVGLTFLRPPLFDARLYWARTLVPADRTLDGDDRIHFMFRMGF